MASFKDCSEEELQRILKLTELLANKVSFDGANNVDQDGSIAEAKEQAHLYCEAVNSGKNYHSTMGMTPQELSIRRETLDWLNHPRQLHNRPKSIKK